MAMIFAEEEKEASLRYHGSSNDGTFPTRHDALSPHKQK
jgi:hypothetical protein